MSEVKRYGHISYLVEATPQILELYPSMTVYTLASDFDAAQVELTVLKAELACEEKEHSELRDVVAALREELERRAADWQALNHEFDNVDKRLAAAEQRNSEQLSLLHMSKELLSTISLHRTMAPNDWCDSFKNEVANRLEKLRAVLAKPTESGASEGDEQDGKTAFVRSNTKQGQNISMADMKARYEDKP